jgi:FAD/FMN-containing dehydrogenase
VDVLIRSLVQIAGETGVLTEPADLDAFVTDFSGRYKGNAVCVVRPRSTEEVAAVVAQCVAHSVPIQAQGGNTNRRSNFP